MFALLDYFKTASANDHAVNSYAGVTSAGIPDSVNFGGSLMCRESNLAGTTLGSGYTMSADDYGLPTIACSTTAADGTVTYNFRSAGY